VYKISAALRRQLVTQRLGEISDVQNWKDGRWGGIGGWASKLNGKAGWVENVLVSVWLGWVGCLAGWCCCLF
jgi:hypothetical protein